MVKDLSPKLSGIQKASSELYVQPVDVPIGQRIGGLSTYSNSFKRGSGSNVFGSDENGIWLGSPDFEGAPFSVSMAGAIFIRNGDDSSLFNADGFVFYEAGIPAIVIGDP